MQLLPNDTMILLEEVNVKDSFSLWSQPQKEFADRVMADFTIYEESENTERSFVVCVDGPTGSGKSSFCRWIAERQGYRTFRAAVLCERSADIATDIAADFAKLRALGLKVILIWDDIEGIIPVRRSGEKGKRRTNFEYLNDLLREIDRTRCLLLCTTDSFDILGADFKYRIGTNRFSIKTLTADQREQCVMDVAVAFKSEVLLSYFLPFVQTADSLDFRRLQMLVALGAQALANGESPGQASNSCIRKVNEMSLPIAHHIIRATNLRLVTHPASRSPA